MIPGAAPPTARQLNRIDDRLSFLYLERCTLSRDANAITATNETGTVHIPAAGVNVLLLGPGTRITHHAMMVIAQCGATAVWVGENAVRYYAHGVPLARSTRLLEAQAEAVSHRDRRLSVARRMYGLRFPDEAVDRATMQQLRGREGARVRQIYRQNSERTGVHWSKRDYDPESFETGDAINQALSAAHSCLYGVVHAVIVSLGCSPGLGFVHTGHARSFVYDLADLYKADATIPIAFDTVASEPEDVAGDSRRRSRDALRELHIIERCVKDIKDLLLPQEQSEFEVDVTYLWDDKAVNVAGGVDYSEVEF
ncbi:subtype I-E CRISPR-associated endonuclease Cas1 [Enemella evansiae]|uniref:type I-E CRISPR-associated endonuclease Cas1e n=1 Tax=Enemella evansiae TaxID=2016499 RepID=UPI000B96BE8B|nr:type I-E CRISPR-associated endonuclease Cas1e [Enemella evansiae]OYO16962.1 subtype I-E CRISPR-associated endonuclease Cas1 [Enemella evansiae]